MASKAKGKKPAKKAKKPSKVTKLKNNVAGVGHNGKINKPLQKIFTDYAAMDEDKKAIGAAQRDLRAKAKEEHGVDKGVFSHEVRLQKMAADARSMFEQGHSDLKDSLGYQHVLPLLEGDEEDAEGVNDAGDEQEDVEEGEAA